MAAGPGLNESTNIAARRRDNNRVKPANPANQNDGARRNFHFQGDRFRLRGIRVDAY